MLYILSAWNQSLWKLRILGKEAHVKCKGWGHTQSKVRKMGNRVNSLRFRGRVAGSRKSLKTQGSEQTEDDLMRDGI